MTETIIHDEVVEQCECNFTEALAEVEIGFYDKDALPKGPTRISIDDEPIGPKLSIEAAETILLWLKHVQGLSGCAGKKEAMKKAFEKAIKS